MAETARYVFQASRDAHGDLTRLFDFIQPTAIAMWNLRWQVRGYLETVPNCTEADLDARFARGVNIGGGSLKKIAKTTEWEDQLAVFSSIVLVNCIAIFEDFTGKIANQAHELGLISEGHIKAFADGMQFPPSQAKASRPNPISSLGQKSTLLAGNVVWDSSVARRYEANALEPLLLCYRYFKELRNAISHNGGKSFPFTAETFNKFDNAKKDGKIGGANIPEHPTITSANQSCKLSFRGVIGFSEIIFRIITHYDIILSEYSISRSEVKRIIKPDSDMWPTDQKRINTRLQSIFHKAGWPKVVISKEIVQELKNFDIIPKYVNWLPQ